MRTEGFEVLVQEVIAAMTTLPCLIDFAEFAETCSITLGFSTPIAAGLPPSCSQRLEFTAAAGGFDPFFGLIKEGRAVVKDSAALERRTRSCGRLGPARQGSTVERSRVRCSEYSAAGVRAS